MAVTSRDIAAACTEIEEAAKDVDDLFERLRNESDIKKRRQIAERDGDTVGRLDAALALSTALAPGHARDLLKTFTDIAVGGAIAELFALCEWRRSDEASVG